MIGSKKYYKRMVYYDIDDFPKTWRTPRLRRPVSLSARRERACPSRVLSVPSPGGRCEEQQHGEDLQPPEEHVQGEDDLRHVREGRVVAGRPHHVEAGADVADAGDDAGQSGDAVEVVEGHDEGGDGQDEEVGQAEHVDAVDRGIVHHLLVEPDDVDAPGDRKSVV